MTGSIRDALVGLLPRLRRFGISLTGSAGEAEELVQAACERILSDGAKGRGDAVRLDAWAYAAMRQVWSEEKRGRSRHDHDDIAAAANVVGEDGVRTVGGRLTLVAVRDALTKLSVEQRTVLVLVCVDGLSYAEVAGILGIPIGTVISRVARGRDELRRHLSDGEDKNVIPGPGSKRGPP